MNSREIIYANLEHGNPPRPGLTFNNGRINDMWGAEPGRPKGYVKKKWLDGNREYSDSIWGNIKVRMVDGCRNGETFKAAIEDWSQLKDYHAPEYDLAETTAALRQGFAGGDDKFKTVGMPGWVFSASREIRKMENYLPDMLEYPDEIKLLHAKVSLTFESLIRAAGEAASDGIILYEDMGTQNGLLFSPDMWHEYFYDLYGRLFGMAHEYGMKVLMHSCGQNREILEPLLQVGVDCFQFDQPSAYDMPALAQLLRKYKAALWSPIDIQKILPTGDRKLIEKGVDDMFEHFKGFLIFKNYPDLDGIGVKPEWDNWAYERILHKGKQT